MLLYIIEDKFEFMKVLITTEWYEPVVNGVVTSVLNLREELTRQGHEVRVLTLSANQHSHEDGGVYYIRSLGMGKIYPNARMSLCMRHPYLNQLVEWGPDVIHSQCEFTTFLYARYIAKLTHAPIVHTYHTIYEDYTHYFSPSRRMGRLLVKKFSRSVLNLTDLVIAPTKKVENLLKEYEVEPAVETVPTGICLERFQEDETDSQREALRRSLGIGPDEKILVVVGRLAKEKNVEEIFTFLSRRKNVRCLIVGGGPYREVLEQRRDELGIGEQVIFAGMVKPEQTSMYYKAGDVFVSASNSETQGLTYAEALACGLPSVCRKDACLEGVIENGFNGWQYETEEEFWQAVDRLFSDEKEYRRVASNAAWSARKFSKETFGQKVDEVYREAILYHSLEDVRRKEGQLAELLHLLHLRGK